MYVYVYIYIYIYVYTHTYTTIKVKGISRLGLSAVPLGVGSVPQIYNLKQATDAAGNDLFVDANGAVTTTPPNNHAIVKATTLIAGNNAFGNTCLKTIFQYGTPFKIAI